MTSCFPFVKRKKKNNKEIYLAILGLDNAGKTTTTRSIKGVSSDLVAPTIGFDRIEFSIDKFNINLYDLGGGYTIRDIWESYFAEIYGVIFVVDASDQNRLVECHDVLQNLLSHSCISGKPVLLLANKKDIKDALDESELIAALQLDDLVNQYHCPCRLERCCALLLPGKKLDKAIRDGLRWLLGYIDSDLPDLQNRVETDVAKQARKQELEREARKQRVRLAREKRETLEKVGKTGEASENPELNGDKFRSHESESEEVVSEARESAGDRRDKHLKLIDLENRQYSLDDDMSSNKIIDKNKNSITDCFNLPPEPKLVRDSQFITYNSQTRKSTISSLLNSQDLRKQIQLACSLDLDLCKRKISDTKTNPSKKCKQKEQEEKQFKQEKSSEQQQHQQHQLNNEIDTLHIEEIDEQEEQINNRLDKFKQKYSFNFSSTSTSSLNSSNDDDDDDEDHVKQTNCNQDKENKLSENKKTTECVNENKINQSVIFSKGDKNSENLSCEQINAITKSDNKQKNCLTPIIVHSFYENEKHNHNNKLNLKSENILKKISDRKSPKNVRSFDEHRDSSNLLITNSSNSLRHPSPITRLFTPNLNKLHPSENLTNKKQSTSSTNENKN